MKFLKELVKINLIVLFLIILSNLFDFRVCIFYNVFNIPCPGCGTTRAFRFMVNGDFKKSIEYSIMPIIIITIYAIVIIWSFVDYVRKKETLKDFLEKNKKLLIIITIIGTVIIWIINLNNPLLY